MKHIVTAPSAIEEILTRGVVDVVVADHLRQQLLSGRRLRVKFGIDPTSPHLHLGHVVPFRKLRQFQDLGHQAILIVGDATAMIGDPTGRSETRTQLTKNQVIKNQKTYLSQAAKILDMDALEIRHNGEWYFPMSAAEFLNLTSLVTVQQVLQREDFRARVDDPERPLSTIELTYPIMQGYDSVMVKADVEIGGHDQLLNVLMGRRIQRKFGMPEQDVLTVGLLEGTDGVRKMSKSFDNAVLLEDTPEDQYGKVMSIPDRSIINYLTLLTDVPFEEIRRIHEQLDSGTINPRDAKDRLAREIVSFFFNKEEAAAAAERFKKMFQAKEAPEEMMEFKVNGKKKIIDILAESGIVESKSEARRQIEHGGVKVDGRIVSDINIEVSGGAVIQKGKRHFVRIV